MNAVTVCGIGERDASSYIDAVCDRRREPHAHTPVCLHRPTQCDKLFGFGSDTCSVLAMRQMAANAMHVVRAADTVGGIEVSAFDSLAECAQRILEDARAGRGGFAVAINAEKVISSYQDRTLREIIGRATLRYADGAGVVVALRLKGKRTVRVPGADLWLEILRENRGERLPIALVGASPRVLAATRGRLAREFPRADIVVARDGYEGAHDPEAVLAALEDARPQVVFVAMGSPRQEQLIERLRAGYPQAFYLGLGGSFDVYCGSKRRAPRWMQSCGLEWLYRFLSEPSRAHRERKRLRFLFLLAARRL